MKRPSNLICEITQTSILNFIVSSIEYNRNKQFNEMNQILKATTIIVIFLCYSCSTNTKSKNELLLWYDNPATDWMTEALPVGNGYMGVMFFGGVEKEQIQFSEGSLWRGGPGANPDYNFGLLEDAWKYLLK